MIALRLNIRRDGSVCLVDAGGRAASPDRMFPDVHGFTYEWLAANATVATLGTDEIRLELANGRAIYRIIDRTPTGVNVELADSELFDPPPIDEQKAERLAEQRAAAREAEGQGADAVEARSGSVKVEEAS